LPVGSLDIKKTLLDWRFRLQLLVEPYAALNNIDRQIESICPDLCHRDCYYVEAGANDGLRQSNTYFLEKKYGAKGLLIEPVPHRFRELKKNRSQRNSFASHVLTSFDYPFKQAELIYSDLMTVADLGSCTDLGRSITEHAEAGRQYLSKNDPIRKITVPVGTLTQLLVEAAAPKEIGLVSLDLEGNELSALMGIDFSLHRIRHFVIESRDVGKIDSYLTPRGYVRTRQLSKHDYLFSRV